MTIEPIGIIALLLGIFGLYKGPETSLYIFVPMTLLGAAAALLLGGSGNVQPAHLLLGFLVLSMLSERISLHDVLQFLKFPRAAFWFTALLGYGLAGAFVLPRLFSGYTAVNGIGSSDSGASFVLTPLGPSSGNITQSIYLVADYACFLFILIFGSSLKGFRAVVNALIYYSALNVFFALFDLITNALDVSFLLDFIRNASYQLHTEETTGGLRRIVGSFTETSSFSYASIGSLAFTAKLWLEGYKTRLTGILSGCSLLLLAFSTSTTAYVSMPVVLFVLYIGASVRIFRSPAPFSMFAYFAIAPILFLLFVVIAALTPAISTAIADFMDVAVFAKSTSQSGLERAQWNQTAYQNFIDTYGLGGGLGSIRASSFALAVLSNLGFIGAMCFIFMFMGVFFDQSNKSRSIELTCCRAAARVACFGLLIAGVVSGALVDLGLIFYVYAGLACVRTELILPRNA